MPQTYHFALKDVLNGNEFKVEKNLVTIGRDEESDIVLDSEQGYPSRLHAQLITKHNKLYVDDLHSTNGTFVNGNRVESTTQLNSGDIVKFANAEFYVLGQRNGDETIIARRPSLSAKKDSYYAIEEQSDDEKTAIRKRFPLPAGWPVDHTFAGKEKNSDFEVERIDQLIERALSGQEGVFVAAVVFVEDNTPPTIYGISLDDGMHTWTIGRSEECALLVDSPSVSEHHADICRENNNWIIKDNHSTNGLSINGKKVTDSMLKPGIKIELGRVGLFFKELNWEI